MKTEEQATFSAQPESNLLKKSELLLEAVTCYMILLKCVKARIVMIPYIECYMSIVALLTTDFSSRKEKKSVSVHLVSQMSIFSRIILPNSIICKINSCSGRTAEKGAHKIWMEI